MPNLMFEKLRRPYVPEFCCLISTDLNETVLIDNFFNFKFNVVTMERQSGALLRGLHGADEVATDYFTAS